MKEDCEGGSKRKTKDEEDEVARFSHSLSSSVLAGISGPCSVEEMTSQKHFKPGAKPKWSAHADWSAYEWSIMIDESSTTPVPPSRDKSLWRITTTKTVEALMSEQSSRGVKQNFESQYQAPLKKHAVEYTKLMKKYEEMTASENGTNEEEEEEEAKDQGLKNKVEEILSLT